MEMDWTTYLNTILDQDNILKDISLNFNRTETPVPNIVRASVLLLEQNAPNSKDRNIVVFPEGKETAYLFMITRLMKSILTEEINFSYDPTQFKLGDKLKIGNSVVEFRGIKKENGRTYFSVYTSDGVLFMNPIEDAPFYQKVKSKRLSNSTRYVKERGKRAERKENQSNLVSRLMDNKTHLEGSVIYVGTLGRTRDFINISKLDSTELSRLIHIGKADFSGEVENVFSGQYTGEPTLIIAPELPYAYMTLEKNTNIKYIIIDLTSLNIERELDYLDYILASGIPVYCIADTMHSFNLKLLADRGFNIWRWDKSNITDLLYSNGRLKTEIKTANSKHSEIEYLTVDGGDIDKPLRTLYRHRKNIEDTSSELQLIFSQMMRYSRMAIRRIETLPILDKLEIRANLHSLGDRLKKEKDYISEELYDDFCEALETLLNIFNLDYSFPKFAALKEVLLKGRYKSIYLIVSNGADPESVKEQWKSLLAREGYYPWIEVSHPRDYIARSVNSSEVVVVSSWFSKDVLRDILHSHNASNYVVLLYPYEEIWKTLHHREWERAISVGNDFITGKTNYNLALDVRDKDQKDISFDEYIRNEKEIVDQDSVDDVLERTRFNRYVANKRDYVVAEIEKAIPVTFVGSYSALFTKGHGLQVVTDIITGESDEIDFLFVNKLKVGDFIVIRESSRDIIREVADQLLLESGELDKRELSYKWKESLNKLKKHNTNMDIINRLEKVGCKRSHATMRNWIQSDSIIMPDDIKDLVHIASATRNQELIKLKDQVYEAGKIVQEAHRAAGRKLTEMLKKVIAEELRVLEDVDLVDLWKPININVEGVGNIKVIKIKNIGSKALDVLSIHTNKLLTEEREEMLWQE